MEFQGKYLSIPLSYFISGSHLLSFSHHTNFSAELLFDLEFFKIDPEPFFKFSRHLLPPFKLQQLLDTPESKEDNVEHRYPVSSAHRFICKLNDKKKLLRNYSQNIDGLELLAGLDPRKLVQVHGTIDTLRCLQLFNIEEKSIRKMMLPRLIYSFILISTLFHRCTVCKKKKTLKTCVHDLLAGGVLYCSCKGGGVMKPDITFFGEKLPDLFFRSMENDLPVTSLVIVMGTSLKVL